MAEKKSRRVAVAALAVALLLAALTALAGCGKTAADFYVRLSSREAVLSVGETTRLRAELQGDVPEGLTVESRWVTEDDTVATVGEDGTVTGVGRGETLVKAVVRYDGREYGAACVVTVASAGDTLSSYRIRYFTQRKDRTGYDIAEESFERFAGSEVTLSSQEAAERMPAGYRLNEKTSRLSGTVADTPGATVLEVYYDVAKVSYTVRYYYESARRLGTYELGETVTGSAYAFSEVRAPSGAKTGFRENPSAKGTRASVKSLSEGAVLSLYYDRARASVTFSYLDGRPDATFTSVYGVGLLDADSKALSESVDGLPVGAFVGDKQVDLDGGYFSGLTSDTSVEFRVLGGGFVYEDGGLTLKTTKAGEAVYVYADGKGGAAYLSGVYHTTGSATNMFGVSVRRGGSSREILFQSNGIAVLRDHKNGSGLSNMPEGQNGAYYYNFPGRGDEPVIFVQSAYEDRGANRRNEILDMLLSAGEYRLTWAVWNGTLYGAIDGATVVILPLSQLDASWGATGSYELGFACYDGGSYGDALRVTDIKAAFGSEAEDLLYVGARGNEITPGERYRVVYDALTGNYMPCTATGAAYLYGASTSSAHGLSATLTLRDPDNVHMRVGVSVKVGDKTNEYVFALEGISRFRHDVDHKRGDGVATAGPGKTLDDINNITRYALKDSPGFTLSGTDSCEMTAIVSDGYFYVLIDGVEAVSVNMGALFPGYKRGDRAAVGLHSYNACDGLTLFSNVDELSSADVGELGLSLFRYWTEWGMGYEEYSFAEGYARQTTTGNASAKDLYLYAGKDGADEWDISGKIKCDADTLAHQIASGFLIAQGDMAKSVGFGLYGYSRGFLLPQNGDWSKATAHAADKGLFPYVLDDYPVKYFVNSSSSLTERATDEISFRLVIHDDILYVWFDGRLCWRLPLDDPAISTDPKGEKFLDTERPYHISLHTQEQKLNGQFIDVKTLFEDITVKLGCEVEEQSDLLDEIAAAEAEVARLTKLYSDGEAKSATGDGISANGGFVYDREEGRYLTPTDSPRVSMYAAGKAGTQGLRATVDRLNKGTEGRPAQNASMFGFSVRTGNRSAEFLFTGVGRHFYVTFDGMRDLYDGGGLFTDGGKAANEKTRGVPAELVSLIGADVIPEGPDPFGERSVELTALVKDGRLYLFVGDKQLGSVKLQYILPGYTSGSTVELGFFANNADRQRLAVRDITPLDGAAANDLATTDKSFDDVIFFQDSKVTNGLQGVWQVTTDSVGRTLANSPNAAAMATLRGASDKWEITGKYHRNGPGTKGDGSQGYVFHPGIRVLCGGKATAVYAHEKGFFFATDQWWTKLGNMPVYGTSPLEKATAGAEFFNQSAPTKEDLYFRYRIEGGTLYAFFGDAPDKLTLCWEIPLNKNVYGWDNGSKTFITDAAHLYSPAIGDGPYEVQLIFNNDEVVGTLSDLRVSLGSDVSGVPFTPTYNSERVKNWNPGDGSFDVMPPAAGAKWESYVQFTDLAVRWQASGKVTRSDPVGDKSKFTLGVWVRDPSIDRSVRLFGFKGGVAISGLNKSGAAWVNDYASHTGEDDVVKNSAVLSSFFNCETVERTVNEIYYRFVVANDTLSLFFGDSPASLKLCAVLDLTRDVIPSADESKRLNGFAPGTKYQFAIYCGDCAVGAHFSDTEVASGAAVDAAGIVSSRSVGGRTVTSALGKWNLDGLANGYITGSYAGGSKGQPLFFGGGTRDGVYSAYFEYTTEITGDQSAYQGDLMGGFCFSDGTNNGFLCVNRAGLVRTGWQFHPNLYSHECLTLPNKTPVEFTLVRRGAELYCYFDGTFVYKLALSDVLPGAGADTDIAVGLTMQTDKTSDIKISKIYHSDSSDDVSAYLAQHGTSKPAAAKTSAPALPRTLGGFLAAVAGLVRKLLPWLFR